MEGPLIVRLLLDGQGELVRIADSFDQATTPPMTPLNDPAWVIAHTAFFHDCWLNGDAQGKPREQWDQWLAAWADRQRDARPAAITTDFAEARSALHRIMETAGEFLSGLTDADLDRVPDYEDGAWPPRTTVGYLVARAVAHLFAHASELNVIATASGIPDAGLPGAMPLTAKS